MFDSRWFIDRNKIGTSSALYPPNSGNRLESLTQSGIGHAWIKENWVVADRLMGVLARYFTFDVASGRFYPASMGVGYASPIKITKKDLPTMADVLADLDYSAFARYEIEYDPAHWEDKYIHATRYPTSVEFQELLSKLDGAGNPYWIKFMKTGFTGADLAGLLVGDQLDVNISGIPGVAPAINANSSALFSDFSTKIAIPSEVTDDGMPNYDIDIKSVYNHYSPLFEGEFKESGLNELAMPNFYMMYYAPNDPSDELAIPPVYRRQITLADKFDWYHGPVDELTPADYDALMNDEYDTTQSTSDYYNLFLSRVIDLEPEEVTGVNEAMERYRDIAVRPRSVQWLADMSGRTETDWTGAGSLPGSPGSNNRIPVKSKLPAYVEINFNGNPGPPASSNNLDTKYGKGAGTPPEETIQHLLNEHNLYDHVVTTIINNDINYRASTPAAGLLRNYAIQDLSYIPSPVYRAYDPEGAIGLAGPGYINFTFNPIRFLNLLRIVGDPQAMADWLLTQPGNASLTELFNMVGLLQGIAYDSYGRSPPTVQQRLKHMKGPVGTFLIDSRFLHEGHGQDSNSFTPYAPTEGTLSARASNQELISDLTTKIIDRTRTYSQIVNSKLDNNQCYSETFVYKIEKRVVPEGMDMIPLEELRNYSPLQSFYIANDGSQSFTYIDSQVIYGKKYQYDIKEIRLVIGNSYTYGAVSLSSEYVGAGMAVGNALGFYRPRGAPETPGPFHLAQQVLGDYVSEGEDTQIQASHTGHFIFKIDKKIVPSGPQRAAIESEHASGPGASVTHVWYNLPQLNEMTIKLISGPGVLGNAKGGALSVDAPLWTPPPVLGASVSVSAETARYSCDLSGFEDFLRAQESQGWPRPPLGWERYFVFYPVTTCPWAWGTEFDPFVGAVYLGDTAVTDSVRQNTAEGLIEAFGVNYSSITEEPVEVYLGEYQKPVMLAYYQIFRETNDWVIREGGGPPIYTGQPVCRDGFANAEDLLGMRTYSRGASGIHSGYTVDESTRYDHLND